MNRSLSQLSYRPIYKAVLFPVRCYDPENIDIIAMNCVFVKVFFLGIPAQRFPLRGDGVHYTPSLLRRMISASSGVVVEV